MIKNDDDYLKQRTYTNYGGIKMIRYEGNKELKTKINDLLNEMKNNEDLIYTIHIYESRENEKISKLLIEVSNIENSMPNF